MTDRIALDRASVRRYSEKDGHLHVESSHITKAMVSPYYGHEIPGYEQLGLQPDRVYQLLRDPDELAKAADTFNRLPLLMQHKPSSADDHPRDLTVGATGSDAVWRPPYLDVSLTVWDGEGIAGIESRDQCELSCGYYYDADMTPGEYEGIRYDGVMRNIKGNHVALVDVGRAGHDVVVGDKNPFHEEKPMTLKTRFDALRAKAKTGTLAMDADIAAVAELLEDLAPVIEKLSDDPAPQATPAPAEDEELFDSIPDGEDPAAFEKDEVTGKYRRKAVAQDEDPAGTPAEQAMDAATVRRMVAKAQADAVKQARADAAALVQAQEKVRPLVGNVLGMDSAENVYRFALEHSGVDAKGVHASALPALVDMAIKQAQPQRMAADRNIQTNAALSRFKQA